MIEHLRGRERALESLGWTGREAEWIAPSALTFDARSRRQSRAACLPADNLFLSV